MKKILCIMFALLLVACSPIEQAGSVDSEKGDYITGAWVSYSELDTMLAADFKTEFNTAVKNFRSHGITDVFVHTRAFCDSIYESEYFPQRESVVSYDFDVLEYMISVCHQNKIRFHAWLNPYRVRTADSEIENLSAFSPARVWLQDADTQNDLNVVLNGGIYLNPASSEVQRLIINGIREIVQKYDIDGIHFDDYFYPTCDTAFDEISYKNYCTDTQKPLSLDDWRRANVNALISGAYTAIKFNDKDIIFSISPSASIKENYSAHYADISAWIKSDCVDYIIPQLYFGFDYPDDDFKFDNLTKEWQRVTAGTNTGLLIGLATYKINTDAEPDRAEWSGGTQVIKKQIEICKSEAGISGHIYFSYSSMCEYL